MTSATTHTCANLMLKFMLLITIIIFNLIISTMMMMMIIMMIIIMTMMMMMMRIRAGWQAELRPTSVAGELHGQNDTDRSI